MSNVENTEIAISTAQARLEPSVAVDFPFTHRFLIPMGSDCGIYKVSGKFEDLLNDHMVGCGKVDLYDVEIHFTCLKSGQQVTFALVSVDSGLSLTNAAMLGNGIRHVSNDKNMGEKHEVRLVPESINSRQIRPPSSDLPMLKIMGSVGTDTACLIVVRVKVTGFITQIVSLKA